MKTEIKQTFDSLNRPVWDETPWYAVVLIGILTTALLANFTADTVKSYQALRIVPVETVQAKTPGNPVMNEQAVIPVEVKPGTSEWIKQEWLAAGAIWEEVYAVMQCESRNDNNKWNVNTNGSIDLGYYMINSLHIKSGSISLKDATDPVAATKWAINLWKHSGWKPWVCAGKLEIN